MQTVHKFTLEEVKELLREKYGLDKFDLIEVEDVQITYRYMGGGTMVTTTPCIGTPYYGSPGSVPNTPYTC